MRRRLRYLSCFASVFNGTLSSHTSQVDDSIMGTGIAKAFTVSKNQVHGHLRNLNVHNSMGPNTVHPRVLKAIVDVANSPWYLRSHGSQGKSWAPG